MPSKETSQKQVMNRVTVDKLNAILVRLREAGALSGRLDHRLIVRLDRISNEFEDELDDLLVQSLLYFEAKGMTCSVKLFPTSQSHEDWLFINCGLLQHKLDIGEEDPQMEVPFVNEVREVLRAIKPPKDEEVQALLNLCKSEVWIEQLRDEAALPFRDWLNRLLDPRRDVDDDN